MTTAHAPLSAPAGTGRFMDGKRMLQLAALALAAAASAYLAFAPTYESVATDSSGSSTLTTATLIEVNGPSVVVLLAAPIVITLLPLLAAGRARQPLSIVAAVLLGILTLLGALTVGIFYVPALIVEIVAACLPARRGPSAASRRTLVG